MTLDKRAAKAGLKTDLDKFHLFAYDPSKIILKINGEKVHGYSCDQKCLTTATGEGTDISIFLQGTSLWSGKLKSKLGELVNVDLSYDNESPEGLKASACESFTGVVTTFQVSITSKCPEVVVHISGCEYNRREIINRMRTDGRGGK